jgi:hypothetical protein
MIAILLFLILKINYKNANYYFKHIYYFSKQIMLKYLKMEIIIHLYEFQSHVICVQNFTKKKKHFTATWKLHIQR